MTNQKERLKNISRAIICVLFFVGGLWTWAYYTEFIKIPDKSYDKVIFVIENHSITESESNIVTLNQEQWYELTNVITDINKKQIEISDLNDFYSTIFTILAIIFTIFGLISYNTIKENQLLLEDLKEYEEKVDSLYRIKKYAKQVQRLFEDENVKSSYELNLSSKELGKFNDIKECVTEVHEDNAWVELMIAHQLMSKDNLDDKSLTDAESIYSQIEYRNFFRKQTDNYDKFILEPFLYHQHGLLGKITFDYYKNSADTTTLKSYLIKAARKYEYSLELRRDQKSRDKLQTHSNLSVVLIELAKLELKENGKVVADTTTTEALDYLFKAWDQLRIVEEVNPDFNTFWDQARVIYYRDGYTNEVRQLLLKTTDKIDSVRDKSIFIDKLEEEITEFGQDDKGFPGNKELILEIKHALNKKRYLKQYFFRGIS